SCSREVSIWRIERTRARVPIVAYPAGQTSLLGESPVRDVTGVRFSLILLESSCRRAVSVDLAKTGSGAFLKRVNWGEWNWPSVGPEDGWYPPSKTKEN